MRPSSRPRFLARVAAAVAAAVLSWSSVGAATAQTTGAIEESAPTGPAVCRQCHFDRWESFQNSVHALERDRRTPAAREGCETCHGAGGAHVAGGGGRGIGGLRSFSPALPAGERNAVCLRCHSRGPLALWQGSLHDSRNVGCTDCHRLHGGNDRLLEAATEPELCTGCHLQITGQLLRPSHHPIREGKLTCSDCHNPHGTTTERLIDATTVNDKCYECHAEKRGPFLWEHAPVRESCLNCHHAHGSTHEPLLLTKRPLLCQRCHSAFGHPNVLYALSADEEAQGASPFEVQRDSLPALQMVLRSCTNCHAAVHGSNHPSGKLWHR